MAMAQVVLVRHGESTWNRENRFTGWTDVDLSEKGVQEAHAAGKVGLWPMGFASLTHSSDTDRERLHFRRCLHECAQARHQDAQYCPGRDESRLDPRAPPLVLRAGSRLRGAYLHLAGA